MTKSFTPTIYATPAGTLYLKEPGAALVARPEFLPRGATKFVNSFEDTFDAIDYENDWYESKYPDAPRYANPLSLDDGASIAKFAGQVCYLSFGEKRTRNDPESAQRYFDNIKSSGHGSVLEHANYSMIFWGLDRSWSHEAVRHRAGFGFAPARRRRRAATAGRLASMGRDAHCALRRFRVGGILCVGDHALARGREIPIQDRPRFRPVLLQPAVHGERIRDRGQPTGVAQARVREAHVPRGQPLECLEEAPIAGGDVLDVLGVSLLTPGGDAQTHGDPRCG